MYATPLAISVRPHFSQIPFSSSAISFGQKNSFMIAARTLLGCSEGLVFLRDKYLEAGVTLRCFHGV